MWSRKYRRPRFAGPSRANSTFLITSHLDKNVELHILIRGGIGLQRRLRCTKAHMAYHPNGYSPSNRASREPDWPTPWIPGGNQRQLKLLVLSVWRRN